VGQGHRSPGQGQQLTQLAPIEAQQPAQLAPIEAPGRSKHLGERSRSSAADRAPGARSGDRAAWCFDRTGTRFGFPELVWLCGLRATRGPVPGMFRRPASHVHSRSPATRSKHQVSTRNEHQVSTRNEHQVIELRDHSVRISLSAVQGLLNSAVTAELFCRFSKMNVDSLR